MTVSGIWGEHSEEVIIGRNLNDEKRDRWESGKRMF